MSKRVMVPFVVTLLALAALTGLASVPPDATAAPQATLTPQAYMPFVVMPASLVTPNDPSYGQQWGLAKVDAPHAWALGQGTGVAVAVVDSGVDLTHPDLAGKIVPNAGYNFVAMNTNVQDDNGHGTHVAGIIGAATNNGTGVAGMGWDAKILPVKVLDDTGSGYISDVASGIDFAANSSARIINLSLGGTVNDNTLQTAITNAWNKGKLVVVAAGNCGDPSSFLSAGCNYTVNPPLYPAADQNVVAVGATTSLDTRSSFSSYGSWVDLSAPGSDILSTYLPGTYLSESGTSMASPMVAGLAALVWARDPTLTNAGVQNVLQASADDLGAPGRDDQFGYGRINAYRALQMAGAVAAQGAVQVAAVASPPPPVAPQAGVAARPGVVLVRMKPTVQVASAQASLEQRYNMQVASEIGGLGVHMFRVPVGSEYDTAVKLMADPAVEYAEPDYVVKAFN